MASYIYGCSVEREADFVHPQASPNLPSHTSPPATLTRRPSAGPHWHCQRDQAEPHHCQHLARVRCLCGKSRQHPHRSPSSYFVPATLPTSSPFGRSSWKNRGLAGDLGAQFATHRSESFKMRHEQHLVHFCLHLVAESPKRRSTASQNPGEPHAQTKKCYKLNSQRPLAHAQISSNTDLHLIVKALLCFITPPPPQKKKENAKTTVVSLAPCPARAGKDHA